MSMSMSMDENWLVYTNPQTAGERAAAETRAENALKKANEFCLAHLNAKITLFFEEGEEPGTLADLQRAISLASTEELEGLVQSHSIHYDGGYLEIKI